MAKDQSKRVSSKDLSSDIIVIDALSGIAEYDPHNSQYSVATIQSLYTTMIAAHVVETRADAALHAARDKAVTAEWGFHNAVLGSKDEVKAQFGKDSNELQSLGLKKASEYKRPAQRKRSTAAK